MKKKVVSGGVGASECECELGVHGEKRDKCSGWGRREIEWLAEKVCQREKIVETKEVRRRNVYTRCKKVKTKRDEI